MGCDCLLGYGCHGWEECPCELVWALGLLEWALVPLVQVLDG